VKQDMLVLDVGTGSGIQGHAALEQGAEVVAVDIDKKVVALHRQEKKLKTIHSDLFKKVHGLFDCILFNPPYLPFDPHEPAESRLVTTGGKQGWELTIRFIEEMGDHLKRDGFVLLLISTLTGKERVEQELKDHLYDFKIVDEEKVPYETLYVYRIKKSEIRKEIEDQGVIHIHSFAHGNRGTILIGKYKNKKVAIKAQRVSTTNTIAREAKVLREFERYDFSPQVLFSGKTYFIYHFIEGKFFQDWLPHAPAKKVKNVILALYEAMFTLDQKGYTKEEMHHPYKHILVNSKGKATLLDFERCKRTQRAHNVTQFTQYLCSLAHELKVKKITVEREKMIALARAYTKTYKREEFDELVSALQ